MVNGSLHNKRRMATRSPTLVGREEQKGVGSVFLVFQEEDLFEDNLQDEEEIVEAWLPLAV